MFLTRHGKEWLIQPRLRPGRAAIVVDHGIPKRYCYQEYTKSTGTITYVNSLQRNPAASLRFAKFFTTDGADGTDEGNAEGRALGACLLSVQSVKSLSTVALAEADAVQFLSLRLGVFASLRWIPRADHCLLSRDDGSCPAHFTQSRRAAKPRSFFTLCYSIAPRMPLSANLDHFNPSSVP